MRRRDDDMKIDYFTLLSYEPIYLKGVGSVKSPLLSDIAKITMAAYSFYLSVLLMDIDTYYDLLNDETKVKSYFSKMSDEDKSLVLKVKQEYESIDELERSKICFYDLMIFDPKVRNDVLTALSFFFEEEVEYIEESKAFATYDGSVDENNKKIITGYIHRNIYNDVVDIILQRLSCSNKRDEFDNTKVKNKRAAKMMEKLKKGRYPKKQKQKSKADERMELGNIISSLSTHHKSLNMTNIWNLTVYQMMDQFARQRYEDSYETSLRITTIHGDKEKKFNSGQWYSLIKNENN